MGLIIDPRVKRETKKYKSAMKRMPYTQESSWLEVQKSTWMSEGKRSKAKRAKYRLKSLRRKGH